MIDPAIVKVPVKGSNHSLELEETAGRCAFVDCKVKGGGLLQIVLAEPVNEDLAFTKRLVVCGGCLQKLLLATIKVVEPKRGGRE